MTYDPLKDRLLCETVELTSEQANTVFQVIEAEAKEVSTTVLAAVLIVMRLDALYVYAARPCLR